MGAPSAPVKTGMVCELCTYPLRCRWTDTHGIGACQTCGAPYRLLHYDEDKRLCDKPPTLLINDKWFPTMFRYWNEVGRNVYPGAFNMPGSSYEVATQEDADALNSWIEEHKNELPCMTSSG